jgi:hypothetical protein
VLGQLNVQAYLEAHTVEALDPAGVGLVKRVSLDLHIVRAYQMVIQSGDRAEEAHHEL